MAKVKYDALMGTNYEFEISANYSPDPNLGLVNNHTPTMAIFSSATNFFRIDFLGAGFTYDGEELVDGTVTKVIFRDNAGAKLASISDFHRDAADVAAALADVGGLLSLLLQHADKLIGSSAAEYLIGEAGNDTINGKGGNDAIAGNSGDDTISGGSGNDRFEFYGGQGGDDVITDFELGDDVNFDTLSIFGLDYDIVKSGREAMFLFSDGSTLLLEDVRFSDRAAIHVIDAG